MSRKIDPRLAEEVMLKAGFKTLEPYVGAGNSWKCKCLTCGQESAPTLQSVKRGTRCRYCANSKNGLNRRTPEKQAVEIMLDAGLKPLEPYKNSTTPWKCLHLKCGKVVNPTFGNIRQGHTGCKPCAYLENGLRSRINEKDAVATMLEAGVQPLEPYKTIETKWKCKCTKCGETVYPRLGSVKQGQGACDFCANSVRAKKRLVPEENAVAIMLKARLQPLEPYVQSNKPWKCMCLECKKIVEPTLGNVKNSNSGCPYCAKNKVDPEDVIKFMIKSGLKPLEPYKTTHAKWKCKCMKCGKTVYPNYGSILQGQGGCIYCSKYGFDPSLDGYLYFLEHPNWKMLQIGITNYPKDRIRSHKRLAWEVLEIRGPMDGHLVHQWETAILRMLKANGADLSNSSIAGKFDGYSEAWSKATFEVKSIKELMKHTEEFEEGKN